jgi:hypothetical protein
MGFVWFVFIGYYLYWLGEFDVMLEVLKQGF